MQLLANILQKPQEGLSLPQPGSCADPSIRYYVRVCWRGADGGGARPWGQLRVNGSSQERRTESGGRSFLSRNVYSHPKVGEGR